MATSQSGPWGAFGSWGKRDLRVSDADREQVVESLRKHAGDGRLSVEELTERVGQAYSAKTYGELEAVQHDLPRATPPPSRAIVIPTGPTVVRMRRHRRSIAWTAIRLAVVNLAFIAIWLIAGANFDNFWPAWTILLSAIWVAFRGLRVLERNAAARRGNV